MRQFTVMLGKYFSCFSGTLNSWLQLYKWNSSFLFILVAWNILRGSCVVQIMPQDAIVEYGTTHTLTCRLADDDAGGLWNEVQEGGGVVPIYTGDLKFGGSEPKYDNFELVNNLPIYNLEIRSAAIEDEGTYQCATSVADAHNAEFKVEAKVSSVTVTCQSPCQMVSETIRVLDMTACECTCNAFAGYPRDLELSWNEGDPGNQSDTSSLSGPNGTFDFLRTVTFTAMRISKSLECRVDGYMVPDIKNSEEIKKELPLDILYLPECEVKVDSINVAEKCTVMVTCHCDANPEVSSNEYSYLKNGSSIGGTTNTTEDVVDLKSTVTYSCRANNTVGSGHYVEGDPYICTSPPTTLQPTPVSTPVTTPQIEINSTMSTSPDPTVSSLGLIVGLSVGVPLLLILIGVLVYWFFIKKRDDEKRNNLAVSGGNTNPSYTEPGYGVIEKDTQPKSDNTGGNGVNAKLAEEQPEYAAVNKPKSQPQAAPRPRSSQPPDNKEQMELQYADLDHGNRGPSKEIRKPADEPTEYATVQSVIV